MKNAAFLFPGQGSQYVGMGIKLYDLHPLAMEMYEEANSIAGFDLLGRDLKNPSKEIFQTEFAQPAILALSVIAHQVYKNTCSTKPRWMAGHSLGEYAALVCSGAIAFEDAIGIVKKRAQLMSMNAEGHTYGMAAVLGIPPQLVEDLLKGFQDVFISNYNSYKQTVISGRMENVEEVINLFRVKGADIRILKTNLPFHTPLLDHTTDAFRKILNQCDISLPEIPVISNVTAKPYESVAEIRELLSIQISKPVLWTKTMELLNREGVLEALEFGPKSVLSTFFRDTFPKVSCRPMEWNFEDFSQTDDKGAERSVKKALASIAATKNNNSGNKEAALRIQEINLELKNGKNSHSLHQKRVLSLLQEALELKKLPQPEIHFHLAEIKEEIQLFCFPYAGGDASLFKEWEENLKENYRVVPLEYPGRGKKSKIPLAKDLDKVLDELEEEILPELKSPFAFFGHSLGAVLAFELAHRLRKMGRTPKFLALSACPGPRFLHKFSGTRELSNAAFIAKIVNLNGTPKDLFENETFQNHFLPILRADFTLLEDYHHRNDRALDCPALLIRGLQDHNLSAPEIHSWSESFSQESTLVEVSGDHFFIRTPQPIYHALIRMARRTIDAEA